MNNQQTRYVVGFMFNASFDFVALIRKQKPAWQAGLLNGIGGKIEGLETDYEAIVREFKEETGFSTELKDWNRFCQMAGTNNDGSNFAVEFFYSVGPLEELESNEIEEVLPVQLSQLLALKHKTVGNVPWLVSLALDFANGAHPPKIVYANY